MLPTTVGTKTQRQSNVYRQQKTESLSHSTWIFSLNRRLSLPRSLHFSLALPVNPRWDLAHTHWNSLQPKVGQKPSEDRAQGETEGETERGREVGTGGWGEMTESNWQGTQRRRWFFIICTYKSYFLFI